MLFKPNAVQNYRFLYERERRFDYKYRENSLGQCKSSNISLEVLQLLVFMATLVKQSCAVASVWRPLLPKVASAPLVGSTTGYHLLIFIVFGERLGSATRHYKSREVSQFSALKMRISL